MIHPIQQKLLKLAQKIDLSKMGFRKIGKIIEEDHPQKIKHHLEQLEKKGLIYRNKKTRKIEVLNKKSTRNTKLFRLPILGSANCGQACIFAEENIEGYLQVSYRILERRNPDSLFVIKAEGESLNRAKDLKGGTVENGDYLIIDCKEKNPSNGDYILSVIDSCANIKRFYKDKTGQVSLLSESTLDIAPIYIHPSDFSDYMVNGKVIRVIKKPKIK